MFWVGVQNTALHAFTVAWRSMLLHRGCTEAMHLSNAQMVQPQASHLDTGLGRKPADNGTRGKWQQRAARGILHLDFMPLITSDDPHRQLARLFLIYNTLEVGGQVSGHDLSAACNVTTRTIRRDLRILEEAGAFVRYDRKRRTYRLEQPLRCLQVELSGSDVFALALAQATLPGDAPYSALARRAFAKLASRLPERLREGLTNSHVLIEAGNQMRRDYNGVPWRELLEAAGQQQTLRLDYYSLSSDRRTLRDVDPYHLIMPHGYLQLVGFCHVRGRVINFALDGIRSLHPTGRTFQKLPGFSLSDWMADSLGTLQGEPVEIVVRFEPHIARWAKRRKWTFRHTLEVQATPEGEALLLRGTVSGLDEIRAHLLSWGAGVTVLEPEELRRMMRQEAEAMLRKYNSA